MKLTRRQLVIATAGSALAADVVKALAQSATAAPTPAPSAADRVRQNADTLEKFAIPISTEPAFQFKA